MKPAKRQKAKSLARKSSRGAKPRAKARPAKTAARRPAEDRGAQAGLRRPRRASRRRPWCASPHARRLRPRLGPCSGSRWLAFIERHGVVLASARGPVPCVAEAVAGEPIIGSWWAHSKGKAIFDALSELDDSDDVRCFKLVDGKVTFVHRRVWPALARLASDGAISAGRVASIQQEHMPTGEHRNLVTPFPEWVPRGRRPRGESALTAEAAQVFSSAAGSRIHRRDLTIVDPLVLGVCERPSFFGRRVASGCIAPVDAGPVRNLAASASPRSRTPSSSRLLRAPRLYAGRLATSAAPAT